MMANQFFQVQREDDTNVLALEFPESIDSIDFDRLNASILGEIEPRSGERWIIDLTKVHYMGSAMLGLMVNLRQQIKTAHGSLFLCAMPVSLLRIFRTCSLEKLFVIVKTRAEAMKK